MGTHYSFSQNPKKLNDWAEAVAERIKLANLPNIMLCYAGMSGISSATALMLKLHEKNIPVEMCYVRKPDEQSHGTSVELSTTSENYSFTKIFVDDFIASADTFKRVEVQCGGEINFLALQTSSREYNLPFWDKNLICRKKHTIFYDDETKTNF